MKRDLLRAALLSLLLSGLVLSAAPAAWASPSHDAHGSAVPGHWVRFRHVPGVVDLAGPHRDGSFTVAAAGRLFLLSRAGVLRPFARGRSGYSTAIGPEPYLTMTGSDLVAGTRCSFGGGTIFAIQPGRHPGVIMIGGTGRARRFVSLPAAVNPDGITFDTVGHFGHTILVIARDKTRTTVFAIGCAGGVRTVTTRAPWMEGGIAVAPVSFGRYGGDLIAPDETTGRVYAISPDGAVATLVTSGLPHGGDIGVESTGFVPPGFTASDSAYLADRYSRGNKHPGTNSILRLPGAELIRAGAHPGDLLVATEGSARTIMVRCASSCTVRYIAIGLAVSHAEGHIVFTG